MPWCAPQKSRPASTADRGLALPNRTLWHDERMVTLVRIALRLIEDALRWVVLLFRSTESVHAENLFLRRQLALYIERGVQPRPGRRGDSSQPGATGKALRLARRTGGRAAGNDDPLASRRLEIVLANEVSARSTADPDRNCAS